VREEYPTRSGPETGAPAIFEGAPCEEWRLDADAVSRGLDGAGPLLVDARAEPRFRGDHEPLDAKAGHIPGARNYFFQRNLTDDRTFRSAEDLRVDWLALLDGTPPAQAVLYCGSGVTACHNLLAMEHAGLPGARIYPGSWSEWSSDAARPIATGE
jgi:thiosulfate/3-mercaptopyruvate sulfurtransferase